MKTKTAAIYNVFDGTELLTSSMLSVKSGVDVYIIVYQNISNFGEYFNSLEVVDLSGFNYVLIEYTPNIISGAINEIEKRNLGIQKALELECTHFLHLDTDELYKDFDLAKQLYLDSGFEGSVCSILTYFKHPTLCFDSLDGYYVPFIHKLTPNTTAGNANYPYYVDPTRRINCENVTLLPITMHHFSWVRKNIEQKCRNSSAKHNIERGTMLQSYYDINCKEGFYVKDYEKTLIKVADCFNLNSIFA